MVLYDGFRSELSNRAVVEMSLSVTKSCAISIPIRSGRGSELPVSKLGGKPCGVAWVAIFHPSIWAVCLP